MNTLQIISEYSTILIALMQAVFVWVVWSLRKEFMRKGDCEAKRASCSTRWDALDDAHNGLQRMDTELEARLDALPPGEEIRALRVALAGVKGEITTLAAKVEGQSAVMLRLEKQLDLLMRHHIKEG